MRQLIIFILLLTSIQITAQNLAGTRWHFSGIITETLQKTDTLKLSSIDTSSRYNYGMFMAFGTDGTFDNYYTAPCGNDCFPRVMGTYTVSDGQVRFYA